MRVQPLIEDDLNKRSAKHANKSSLVAKGTDTQLGYSCVSAPLATSMDLWNPIKYAIKKQRGKKGKYCNTERLARGIFVSCG